MRFDESINRRAVALLCLLDEQALLIGSEDREL
jgi:hypothetical protein